MAIEEATYTVVERDGEFEIRDYAPHVVAETVVAGSFDRAGNEAFSRLFRYISGDNRSRHKVAMTAPVSQGSEGEKIAMTAPVEQQPAEDRWVVSFTMPASSALETLPQPGDPQVTLRQVPARRWLPESRAYKGNTKPEHRLDKRSQVSRISCSVGINIRISS